MNRTIGQILRTHLVDQDQANWPNFIALAELAINSTVNASINKAPFEVLYGENIPLPVDLLLARDSTIDPHASSFATKMQSLVKSIQKAMHTAQLAQKHFHDRHHRA